MLTIQQRTLVQDTWALLTPIQATAAALFYQRLFQLDPALHTLFAHSDMAAQGRKLMQMIDVAVAQLDRLDTLVPAVAALGMRHTTYGVLPSHYDTVGEALLWTLEHGLGTEFTDDVRDAWIATYGLLADVMRGPVAVAQHNAA